MRPLAHEKLQKNIQMPRLFGHSTDSTDSIEHTSQNNNVIIQSTYNAINVTNVATCSESNHLDDSVTFRSYAFADKGGSRKYTLRRVSENETAMHASTYPSLINSDVEQLDVHVGPFGLKKV